MRCYDWQKRLIEQIQAAKTRPFSWGKNDCLLFVADCVGVMTGRDIANKYRGSYDSEISARKVLLKTHGSIEKALADYLLEIPVKLAQRGDVAIIENGGNRCAGIVWIDGVYAVGERGLVLMREKPLRAWRVN